jgi:hypothetical protein
VEHRYYQDRPSTSTGSIADRLGTPKRAGVKTSSSSSTVPTKKQFQDLMSSAGSDVRLKDPNHGLQVQVTEYRTSGGTTSASTTTVTPGPSKTVARANHGDLAVGPDGKVDYNRMPQRPADLPGHIDFRVVVENKRWRCEFVDRS